MLLEIVKKAFGDDYKHDAVVLHKELMHAQGCGCGQCMSAYDRHMEKTVFKYTKPAVEEYGPDL